MKSEEFFASLRKVVDASVSHEERQHACSALFQVSNDELKAFSIQAVLTAVAMTAELKEKPKEASTPPSSYGTRPTPYTARSRNSPPLPPVPIYGADFRALINSDFGDSDPVEVNGRHIFFDPEIDPGVVRKRADGTSLEYVPAKEYFLALLSHYSTITPIFIALGDTRSPIPIETRREIDDAIAAVYWNEYKGYLVPPRVAAAITRAQAEPNGDLLSQFLESAKRSILTDQITLEEAMDRQIEYRIRALKLGAEARFTDRQTAVAEAVTDLILLQRAAMEDVRKAEKDRAPGVPRYEVLCELEKNSALHFAKMLPTIINTQRLLQEIPKDSKALIEAYAQKRKPYHRTGIFLVENDA